MDYLGKDGTDFHLTLSEYKMIFDLLKQLGADLGEWTWTSRGDFISEKFCRSWAATLKSNIARVKVPEWAEQPRDNPVLGTP